MGSVPRFTLLNPYMAAEEGGVFCFAKAISAFNKIKVGSPSGGFILPFSPPEPPSLDVLEEVLFCFVIGYNIYL